MTAKRLDVWCPVCRWRGKVRSLEGLLPPESYCPREHPGQTGRIGVVRGTPPKGGTVGRPRLSAADRLRRKAAELVAIADELDE